MELPLWLPGQRGARQFVARAHRGFGVGLGRGAPAHHRGLVREALWDIALREHQIEITARERDIAARLAMPASVCGSGTWPGAISSWCNIGRDVQEADQGGSWRAVDADSEALRPPTIESVLNRSVAALVYAGAACAPRPALIPAPACLYFIQGPAFVDQA